MENIENKTKHIITDLMVAGNQNCKNLTFANVLDIWITYADELESQYLTTHISTFKWFIKWLPLCRGANT